MKTFQGVDMFQMPDSGDAICITTNGDVNKFGKNVMGKGVALKAKTYFPGIDEKLGEYITKYGNRAFNLGRWNYNGKVIFVFSFPTKDTWKNGSDVSLICKSAQQIVELTEKFKPNKIYFPKAGCGCGGLTWNVVSPWLETIFEDDRFVACI